jgi:hypothetical protein
MDCLLVKSLLVTQRSSTNSKALSYDPRRYYSTTLHIHHPPSTARPGLQGPPTLVIPCKLAASRLLAAQRRRPVTLTSTGARTSAGESESESERRLL